MVTCPSFCIYPLTDLACQQMKIAGVWSDKCPVPLERLRTVEFSYYDFEGTLQHQGKIVVLDAVARRTLTIFQQLYGARFPIAKAHPIEKYQGNDNASMEDNNSSAFNCRVITGGTTFSLHAYGVAIDINPVQNPYISFSHPSPSLTQANITPFQGWEYINRTHQWPGMVEPIVSLFKENGFTIWGGNWTTPIDWQHFQVPRSLAGLLVSLSPEKAEELFEVFVSSPSSLNYIVDEFSAVKREG